MRSFRDLVEMFALAVAVATVATFLVCIVLVAIHEVQKYW